MSLYQNISASLQEISNKFYDLSNLVDQAREEFEIAQANATEPLWKRVKNVLDGEYDLRTMQAIIEATNASREQIVDALDDQNIGYVLKRRRRDGAELIGLASRN